MRNAQLQRGIILPITLISLVILLISSIALIRSTDTSLLVAGHLGFKRDVLNQAELAMPTIKNQFTLSANTLSKISEREKDLVTKNYYASIQASNTAGIPTELLNTSAFDAKFGTNNIVDSASKVTIRYLIDRMCLNVGPVSITECSTSSSTSDVGGDAIQVGNEGKASGTDTPVYRITIRVTGPRNTEAFTQSTFTI